MPIEQELKLALTPDAVAHLRRHPLINAHKTARAVSRQLRTVYFDTPDHRLLQHQYSLRIRHTGQRRIQTIKGGGVPAGGLHSRPEWEFDIAGERPDLSRIADQDLGRELLALDIGNSLVPVFTTDIKRTVWPLQFDDGCKIELAIDIGQLTSGHRRLPVCEVELELKAGPPSRLFDLAARLHADIPLRLETLTKSGRGYALARGDRPAPVMSVPIQMRPEISVENAFKAVARTCLDQLTSNEACALLGEDAEGIHQMRVGLRRLRSAFNLFRPVLPLERHGFENELRWFGQELGPARDWDVFIQQTLAPMRDQLVNEHSLDRFAEVAEQCRQEAYAKVAEVIRSPRYTDIKLRLGGWLARDDWHQELNGEQAQSLYEPIYGFANVVLQRRHRKLRKLGKQRASLSIADLHALRIRAKKIRYAADFFRDLYSRKSVRQYSAALAQMQDMLGTVNDSATGEEIVAAAIERSRDPDGRADPQEERAGALIAGWFAARMGDHMGRFADAWDDFAKLKQFWDRPAQVMAVAEVSKDS